MLCCRPDRHWLEFLSIGVVLLVALILRLSGITWGLPTEEVPTNFQPDETYVMNALSSVDFAKGEFTPKDAHLEGTLAYYLWQGVIVAAKAIEIINVYPNKAEAHSSQYSKTILIGRLMIAIFDIACVALIYLVLRRMRVAWAFACVGAATFAVIPFEVIYSHYMRPHTLANFFVTLTILLTVKMTQSLHLRWAVWAGFCCGLATATRYPGILAVVVPFSALVYDEFFSKGKLKLGLAAACDAICSRRLVALGCGVLAGFFMADPMLFLDFRSALALISGLLGAADLGQFSPNSLGNFNKLWEYISFILPQGAGPHLWILLYASFLAAMVFRRRWRYTIPLMAYVLIIVFVMGKGYFLKAEFVRTLVQVFPPLVILVGVCSAEVWNRLRGRLGKTALVGTLCFFLGGATLFDAAYVRGMMLPDPRVLLTRYLSGAVPEQPLHVGVVVINWMSEGIAAPLRLLEPAGRVKVTSIFKDSPPELIAKQDVICLVDFMPGDYGVTRKELARLTAGGRFQLEAEFRNRLSFAGVSFSDENLPHDMAYPFPRFYLLRAADAKVTP